MSNATNQQETAIVAAMKLARSAILDALKGESSVAGKWKIASERMVAAFGAACFIRKDQPGENEEIRNQAKAMVDKLVGIPDAPAKDDVDADAKKKERQAMQNRSNTYFERMTVYAVGEKPGKAGNGASKSAKEVFEQAATRIQNLYFKKGDATQEPMPSVKFGADMRILILAMKEFAKQPRPFLECVETAVEMFNSAAQITGANNAVSASSSTDDNADGGNDGDDDESTVEADTQALAASLVATTSKRGNRTPASSRLP